MGCEFVDGLEKMCVDEKLLSAISSVLTEKAAPRA
jgi:hypothetical protein